MSFRRRLALSCGAAVAVTVVLGSALAYWVVRDTLRDRLDEIPSGRPVIVHCGVGLRAHTAARLLAQHGFDVANLDGGHRTWLAGTRAGTEPGRSAAAHALRPAG